MTEQSRICPSCAAANPPSRELCARCGAGLDDGVLPPHPVRREAPDPPTVEPAPRSHARWLVPVLGAVVVVAALVVGLTLVGFGPLAAGPDVPAAEFDADAYGEPGPLLLSDIATRTSAEDADAEAPAAIADGDPSTAWRSAGGVDPDAEVLDTIDLVLDEAAWIERIELRNGDHLDREAYDASAPLRRARLTFDGGEVLEAELLDIGLRRQAIDLPRPLLTTVLRIDVLERVAGPRDQLAVSEISLIGWLATGDDVELAERRASAEPATGPVAQIPASLGRTSGQSS